jgi:chromosome segregation ATPase
MSIPQLQNQIKEREDKIARIQQSKAGFEQQLSALRTEEQSLIVPARTGENTAKARLVQIHQDINLAEREVRDDAAAISHITGEVGALRASLASEQFEAARSKVLKEVAQFTERAKASRDRIAAAAQELRKIGTLCESEADAVRNLLCQLDGEDGELASKSERTVKISALELTRSLTKAVNLLEAPSYMQSVDCTAQMQRFIVALEHLTSNIEREAGPVFA